MGLSTSGLDWLADMFTETPVKAALVGAVAGPVVGACFGWFEEAPSRRTHRAHGRALSGLQTHFTWDFPFIFAAVRLVFRCLAPVSTGRVTSSAIERHHEEQQQQWPNHL